MPINRLDAAEAAKRLGVCRERVYDLIGEGRLKAERFGRSWMIKEQDLEAVMIRPGGRPRKGECTRGHAYTEANTYVSRSGSRHCRICGAARARRLDQAKKNGEPLDK